MFGPDKLERKGIIPRAVEHIFKFATEAEAEFAARPEANAGGIASVDVKCSFFQIYNEQVLDLLNPTGTEGGLAVRQSVDKGVYVENLRQLQCKALQEVPNPNPSRR